MSGVWREEAGDPAAPTVLLIHGSMDRSAGLLRLSRRVDTSFRVVRYDRRGYGRSKPHPGPFDMGAQVADAFDVAADRRCLVIGHSYGGNVALALAARHPHLVRGVAVFETPLSWESWWPGTTAGARAVAAQGDPAEAAERFMRRLIGDERWEALPERVRLERRAEGAAMVGELSDLRRHRPWEASDIRVPVVAGYGEHGSAHHRQAMEYLARTLPDADVVCCAGARHDAPHAHPGEFERTVFGALLSRCPAP